jgi:hypothetical protein
MRFEGIQDSPTQGPTAPSRLPGRKFPQRNSRRRGAALPWNLCLRMPILALSLLAACGLGGRSSNVKPGEADYPVENPDPKQVIPVTIIAPPGIKLTYLVGYGARNLGEAVNSGKECWYSMGLGPTRTYSVTVPFEGHSSGEVLHTKLIIDKYEPGRCDYRFAGIYWMQQDQWPLPSSLEQLLLFDAQKAPSTPDARADIWCMNIKAVDGSRITLTCSGLAAHHAYDHSVVPPEEIGPLTASGVYELPSFFGPATRSIVIQVHDMRAPDHGRTVRSE